MRGWKKDTNEEVAVKQLTKTGKNQGAIDKMRREIEIMKKVRHPHCVRLHAVYESANHIYIVMDMLRGGELLQRVIEKECYTEMEAAKVFVQIVQGIKYLHSIGIVHRDLKPDNIMFADKEGEAIKICDYGLSKLVDAAHLASGRARINSRCGTPNFVAPEIFEGQPYGNKVDVWSAGVMLYVLLCGFLPFEQTETAVAGEGIVMVPQINDGYLDFPSPYWDHISKDARHLISRMLQIEPRKRISIEEVLEHEWLKRLRRGDLPSTPMPQMQTRLEQLRSTTLMGAVLSLTALRRMRAADRDWPAVHQNMKHDAESRLAAVRRDAEREEELRAGFDLLDGDQSGRISVEDLAKATAALGVKVSRCEVQAMLARFDLYKVGALTFEAFCIMMGPNPGESTRQASLNTSSIPSFPSSSELGEYLSDSDGAGASDTAGANSGDSIEEELEEELRHTFEALDVDRSGFIDPANVREVLGRFGVRLTEQEAAAMLKTGDVKGDGVIDFQEFAALMCRPLVRSASGMPLKNVGVA